MNKPILDLWAEVMAKGDWVMWALMAIAATLWFAIGYRVLLLQRGTRASVAELLANPPPYREKRLPFRGFLVEAAAAAGHVRQAYPPPWANTLDSYFAPLTAQMNAFRSLVSALVSLAPMAGLLGTVLGMMTMFNSIGDSNFSSQSGGITNGIAQALYATEVALIIAVPSLIVGRALNRREDALKVELHRLLTLAAAQESEAAS